MNPFSQFVLAVTAALFAVPLSAQADEHAIRQTDQISVLEMATGINAYYTVTIRTWSDCVVWQNAAGSVLLVETAQQLAARAYQITPHSNGNVSLRLRNVGASNLNGGTIALVSRGAVVDRDRIRVY